MEYCDFSGAILNERAFYPLVLNNNSIHTFSRFNTPTDIMVDDSGRVYLKYKDALRYFNILTGVSFEDMLVTNPSFAG